MPPGVVRTEKRDTAATGRAVTVAYLAVIVAVPTIMWRAMSSLEILKATVLVVLVLVLVALRSYRVVAAGFFERAPRLLMWSTAAFAGALVVTSMLSPQPWVAFTGAPMRGIGAVTYLACLVLLGGVFRDYRKRSVEPLLSAFLAAHAVVVGYALLQSFGADPFSWIDKMAIGGYVSSTLLNPNFSSSFVAITLPLVVRHQFNPSLRPAYRVVAAAAVPVSLAAIAFMDSFQAQLAAFTALLVPVVWVMQQPGRRRFEALLHTAPTAVTIVLLPVLLSDSVPTRLQSGVPDPLHLTGSGSVTVAVTMVVLGGWTWIGIKRQTRWTPEGEKVEPVRRSGTYWLVVTLGATVSAAAAAVIAWPMIGAQVASGLDHRREMWIVGLKMLRDNPLVGTGLETYFFYFSPLRPVEHAVRFEGLVSDNVHSVPLGMFSGGGLLLGLTYLALLGVIGAYAARALRRSSGSEQVMIGAVLGGWVAYQIQSSISIDVPGLVYTQWVLAGVLLARGITEDLRVVPLPWTKPLSARARRSTRARTSTPLQRHLAVGVAAIVLLLTLGPVIAPLRADIENRNGNVAYLESDLQGARRHMVRAVALQPRNGRYLQVLSLIYAKAGELESARLHIEQSARLQPGVASVAKLAARINNDLGDSDRAVYWYELALASEPYGPRLLAEAADYYETVGESELMNIRLADYEALQLDVLDPVIGGIPGAALRLARGRRDLGNAERASYWYEAALVQVPHDPVLLVEATRFYSDSGYSGLMFARLEREELVDWSVDYDQWELIADLYDVLGDGEYADRIRDPVGAARTFLDLGNAERASHWYERALVREPCEVGRDFDYLHHEAVDVYEALGDITGAERTLDRLASVSCP